MKLNELDIDDLRRVLEAAYFAWQMKPRDRALLDAVKRLQAKVEEHENG